MDTSEPEAAVDRVREYFAAFQRGDSHAYAAQWVYPACIFSGGEWKALPDPDSCRDSNDRYMRKLREMGVTGGRVLELTAREVGPGAAWVDGRFSREGAAGRVIAEAHAAYLVVRTGDAWRIAVCVVKD